MTVRKASLGKLTFLAEGRSGRIFRAERFCLPGDGSALAYKELTAERAGQVTAAVAFRERLNATDRGELDRYFAWPRALVSDDSGKACGFLMPVVPAAFRARQPDPGEGWVVARPRELSWLAASGARRAAARIDLPEVGATDRLVLLAHLVYAIGRLHAQGWVYGDLSLARAVFAMDPPRVLLLGCDGAAPLDDPDRRQSSTPGWDPPECRAGSPPGARQDAVTDAHKLGLAMLRVLVPAAADEPGGPPRPLPGELDPVGADLLTRALSADRARRPTAKDLYGYLCRVVACQMAAREPVIVGLSSLPRPHVPALDAPSFEPLTTLGAVTASFAGRLPARATVPDLPRVPPVPAFGLIEGLRPGRPGRVAPPRLDEAIVAASGAVRDFMQNEGQRYVATLRNARRGDGNDRAHG